jgi:hypothetical protein
MKNFAQGRTAFYYGLLKLKIKKNNKILIPNYICKSLLTPILKLNINYKFYNIKNNFTFDLHDIKKIALADDYLLIIHYFGQPQNIDSILDFCKKNNLKLIEDNAHGYSGRFKGKLLGTFGELGFSSPKKILNTNSGGILYFKGRNIKCNLSRLSSSRLLILKEHLKNFFFYQYFKNKLYNQSNFYLKKIERLENSILNYSADSNSDFLIKKTNWKLIGDIRIKRWIKVIKIFKRKKCKPIFELPKLNTCPWLIPFYASNKFHRDEIILWGVNRGLKLITWPNLPIFDSQKDTKNCRLKWEKLFCVELDNSIDSYFFKKYG